MGIRLHGVGHIDRRVVIIDSPTILDQLIISMMPTSSSAKMTKFLIPSCPFYERTIR